MKVAIIGGFKYHLECVAFICELFPPNIEINLYYIEEYFGYVPYFKQLYPNLRTHTTFTKSDITSKDIIIKLTSNDPIIEDERILSILHISSYQDRSSKYISLSPFVLTECKNQSTKIIKYIFPIYRGIKSETYDNIITYIGHFQNDYYDEDLKQMIIQLPEYEFFFISHNIDQSIFDAHTNVICFPQCDAYELVSLVSRSKYILHRHISVSNFDRFSGALSIAISHRKPLILSSYFAEIYKLPAITYDYLFCETIEKIRNADYAAELTNIDAFIEKQTLLNQEAFTYLLNAHS